MQVRDISHAFWWRLGSDVIVRQIPYAIGQFTVNEFCHEAVFRSVSEEKRMAMQSSSITMFNINLGSGIIAGFAAAILSQPADTLLSQVSCFLLF